MGGNVDNPSYQAVCGGDTGHAEVVRVTFDPAELSFEDLLAVFFTVHDPTTLNRQGNDVGTQYRSVIFYSSAEQRKTAEAAISTLNASGEWPDPLVTAVVPAGKFYMAEPYHQEYYANNPNQSYCRYVVAPKVEKFMKYFGGRATVKA